MLLTSEQLVLIRAALLFWSEELGPHGFNACQSYLDEPIPESQVTSTPATQLREQLQRCVLRYVPRNVEELSLTEDGTTYGAAVGETATLLVQKPAPTS